MPTRHYKEPRQCACGYTTSDIPNWSTHKKRCPLVPNEKDARIASLEKDKEQLATQLSAKDEHAPESHFGERGWRRFKETTFYFHRERTYYRNWKKPTNRNHGSAKGEITLPDHSYYLFKNALYETFFGTIPEGQHVRIIDIEKDVQLSNLECVDTVCGHCAKPIHGRFGQLYCDTRCKQRANPGNLRCHNDLRAYLASKCKGYACTTEEASDGCGAGLDLRWVRHDRSTSSKQ